MKQVLLICAAIAISWAPVGAYEIVELLDGCTLYGNRVEENLKGSFSFLADSVELQIPLTEFTIESIDKKSKQYLQANLSFDPNSMPAQLGIETSRAKVEIDENPIKKVTLYYPPKMDVKYSQVNTIMLPTIPEGVVDYLETSDGVVYEGHITYYDFGDGKYVMVDSKGRTLRLPMAETDKIGLIIVDTDFEPSQFFDWISTIHLTPEGKERYDAPFIEGYPIEYDRAAKNIKVLSEDGFVKKNVKIEYITSIIKTQTDSASVNTTNYPDIYVEELELACDSVACDTIVCDDAPVGPKEMTDISDKLNVNIRTVGLANKDGKCLIEVVVSNPTKYTISAPLRVTGKNVSYSADLTLRPSGRKTFTVPVNNIVFKESRTIKVKAGKKVHSQTITFTPNLSF